VSYRIKIYNSEQKLVARSYVADIDGYVGASRSLFFHTNGTTIQMHNMDTNTDQVFSKTFRNHESESESEAGS
jgi:hypothetical protein